MALAARPSKRRIKAALQHYVPVTISGSEKLGERRNLLIVQDDFNEFNGMISACTLALLRALQSEAAPILVSSSLWFNTCLYLWQHGDEHFLKPKRKNWKLYRVDNDVYLAIPRQYEEKIRVLAQHVVIPSPVKDLVTGKELSAFDIALGLKCSCMREIENPFSVCWSRTINYRLRMVGAPFSTGPDINERILRTAFITNGEVANISQLPSWEIYLVGHGRGKEGLLSSVIGGYSVQGFRSLLSFFEHAIAVRSFMYQTCYGGGKHLMIPYVTGSNPDIYHFTIICCCTTASPSTILYDPKSKHNMDFNLVFKDIMLPSEDDYEERLAAFYPTNDEAPKKRVLHNIPSIRRAGSDEFVALCQSGKDSPIQIYKPSIEREDQVVIDNKQALLLYDQGIVHAPVIMHGSCAALIQMDPLSDSVVINHFDARDQTLKDILTYTFAPVSMFKTPEGTFFIKEMVCKFEEADESPVTLHNVMIRSHSLIALLETPYEQFLESKYLYNFMLRKRVTYEYEGKSYRLTVKPIHGPDYLGKLLMVFDAFINGAYNMQSPWSNLWAYAQDLQPKRLWTLSKIRRLNPSQSKHFHESFTQTYETISVAMQEHHEQLVAQAKARQGETPLTIVGPQCQFVVQ
jgi:hypothetical protein